jgi:uncharacterized protein (DUF1697 family)
MKTYVALLRGINVLGRAVLSMKELTAILESLGCRNATTYIQSGNAVIESWRKNVRRGLSGFGSATTASTIIF